MLDRMAFLSKIRGSPDVKHRRLAEWSRKEIYSHRRAEMSIKPVTETTEKVQNLEQSTVLIPSFFRDYIQQATIGHNWMLQTEKISSLRKTTNTMVTQYIHKRKCIRTEESRTVGRILDSMAEREGGSEKAAEQPAKRVPAHRHCRRCGKTGHNMHTFAAVAMNLDNRESFHYYRDPVAHGPV